MDATIFEFKFGIVVPTAFAFNHDTVAGIDKA